MNKPYDTLWTNVHLATMAEAEGYGIIPNGALGIRDGRIAYVGTAAALGGEPASMARNVEDAGGRWMMPGLIDCHTHLVYAGNRAHEFAMRLNGKSYAEIAEAGGGIVSTVTATREADEERLYAQSARRLEAMLAHGVTTVEIKSGYGLDLTAERKMLRVARRLGEAYPVQVVTTFLGAHALPPEYAGNADEYITYVVEEMLPALHVEGLVDRVDAFCERIGFSAAQVERVFAAASVLKLPVTLHAEQLSDQQGAQLAAKYRALSADHLEYVSEDGIRAMAEAGTVAVLLPGAFYFLKETRIPPVDMLRRYGVPIVLATDCNPGSSPTTNLLLMLNMGCVFFGLTPLEAVQGVTCHAARALGLTTETGTLEVGKVADIALWDISHPEELAYGMGNSLSATSLFHAQC